MSRNTIPRLALFALSMAAAARPAAAQNAFGHFHYAAKIVCGTSRDSGGTVAQRYATTINILSDTANAVLRKSLIITLPPGAQRPQRPRILAMDSIPLGMALASDCQDIARRAPVPPFFEGFLVIDATVSLVVVGVYTVPGGIDVVNVPERRR